MKAVSVGVWCAVVDSVTRELAMEVSESGSPDKSLQTTGNDSTVAPAGDKADPASSSTENRSDITCVNCGLFVLL